MKIGGDVSENLSMIQKHVSEMQNIEKSRKSALQPYTYTIYISFAVFLAVAVLLTTSFFTEIEKVQEGLLAAGSGTEGLFGSLASMEIDKLESALFNMAIIEAVFWRAGGREDWIRLICSRNKTCSCNDCNGSNCI